MLKTDAKNRCLKQMLKTDDKQMFKTDVKTDV
jgi:hypothetical protein